MKRLLIILSLAFASIDAGAQFFTGLSFDIKWANEGMNSTEGVTTKVLNAYSGTVSPQFGYQFNPKFQVGGRVNFLFDKSYFTDTDEKTKETKYVTASIGWDIAPFCRYKIAEFGKNGWFSIWADLHAYYGMMYPQNVQEAGYVTSEFKSKQIYGIQGMPALGFRINGKSTLFVNVAILSLAYSGTYTEYENGSEFNNNVVLFTGKLSGLVTTMTAEGMYGVKFGMIRTF